MICESKYESACVEFIKASDSLCDQWEMKKFSYISCPVLIKKFAKCLKTTKIDSADDEFDFELDHPDPDSVSNESLEKAETCQFECHVIYREAFSNPVLHFLASKSNGEMLSLDECWEQVKDHYVSYINDKLKWSFITQVQHPVFNTPCFQVHPCHTADFLEPLKGSPNYVVSWLSIVMPIFSFSFNPEVYERFFTQKS